MQQMEQNFGTMPSGYLESAGIKTTLYELVEAVSEEICPGEENWVPLIVSHMLDSGRSVPSVI
jgi:hypothetical protein